ncbi:restriction endonuclease subunit S [Bacillus pseudomycoides]|uniref:restriction endonuclease subunit S n=1 Tax=Bacillus pseudomycoides TaxID=64104 RepID=UPI003000C2A3
MNETVTLDKIVTFEKTYSFSRATEGEGEVRHIHYGDIHTKLPSVVEDAKILPTITEKKDFHYLKAGDILVADASEDYKDLGKAICYVDDNSNVIAGLHTHCLRSNQDIVNPEYLINIFQTNRYRKYVWRMGTGVSVLGLSKNNLGKYEVTLPDLDKQKKVASFYKKLNKKIHLQQQKIDLLQEQKKGYMQKIFKQEIRFKDENGKDYPDWILKKVSEIFDFYNGKAHENNIVENGKYIVVNSKFISTEGKVKKYSNELIFPLRKEDIVMVMSDVPNGKAIAKCYLVEDNDKYTLNQRICCLRTNMNPKFFYNQINRNSFYLKFDDGVSQTNLRKEDILNCPLKVPCIDEQEKIANFFESIDKEIQLQQQKIDLLQEQKKGFMQQMFI